MNVLLHNMGKGWDTAERLPRLGGDIDRNSEPSVRDPLTLARCSTALLLTDGLQPLRKQPATSLATCGRGPGGDVVHSRKYNCPRGATLMGNAAAAAAAAASASAATVAAAAAATCLNDQKCYKKNSTARPMHMYPFFCYWLFVLFGVSSYCCYRVLFGSLSLRERARTARACSGSRATIISAGAGREAPNSRAAA